MSTDIDAAIAAEQAEHGAPPPPAPEPRGRKRAPGPVPQPAPAPAEPPIAASLAERLASAELQELLLHDLVESPTNPRRQFNQAALKDLADDIRKHGVLEPILVRGRDREIVFGARRVRAALSAGLAKIPARVADLTDLEVIELQLAENLQRADLHPLEEAEAFDLLHREHHLSAKEIAERYAVGKSEGYVYARIKLCALRDKAAREAFLANKINASVALLIARIPNERLQREFGERVVKGQAWSGSRHGGPEALSYRDALEVYHREFMLRLADAPFRKDDSALVPEAGPCNTCLKRTGNQRELFSDVQSADVCTDPPCFQAKRKAWTEVQLQGARERGQAVIEGKKAKELMPYATSLLHGDVVALDSTCYEDSKHRTYRQLIGKKALEEPDNLPAVVVSPHDGSLHEVVEKKQARRLLKAAGHAFLNRTEPRSSSSGSAGKAAKRDAAKEQREAEVAELLAHTAVERLAEAAEKDKASGKVLELALAHSFQDGSLVREALKRRGIKAASIEKAGLKEAQLRGVFLEVALQDEMDFTGDAHGRLAEAAARAYKLDLKKLEAEIRKRLDEQARPGDLPEPDPNKAKGKAAKGKAKKAR